MFTKILIANSSEALLYDAEKLRNEDLTKDHLIKKILHPESRKKVVELIDGDKGKIQHDGATPNAYEGKHGPKEVEFERFALELVRTLPEIGKLSAKDKLLIVAPAHFYNLIAKHWHHKDVKIENLAKDYTRFTVKDISVALREHLFVV